VTRSELLAIVQAVRHVHHYLYGVPFLVRTDHGALTWLPNFEKAEGQLARRLEVLGTYNFNIKHWAGLKHGNADGLSRRPSVDCTHCDKRDEHEIHLINSSPTRHISKPGNDNTEDSDLSTNWVESKPTNELQEDQLNDPVLRIVHAWLQSKQKPAWVDISHLSQVHHAYWGQWDRLVPPPMRSPCSIFYLICIETKLWNFCIMTNWQGT
jgi:hypothetical protein